MESVDLFDRRNLIEPHGLLDIHGELGYMEAAPGGRLRFWIGQRRGMKLLPVARVVMPILPLINARIAVGHWLQAHGYRERSLILQ